MKKKRKNLTSEELAYLTEHFHNTPDHILAEHLGISVSTIRSRRTKHGWKKDAEYLSKVNHERAIRCNNQARINTPEAYAKRTETRKELYEKERLRIKWGLPQKTKRHFRMEPVAKLLQRNRLQRLGYIIDETRLTAYYHSGTHRATRLEAIPRGTTKGSIHSYYDFRPYDGQMD
jgi:hypothetical protein